jgi:tetratricopeptide (TPR) repeat protein
MSENLLLILRINEEFYASIYKGDPVILSLTISNSATMEDEQYNSYLDDEIAELNMRLEKEEITEEEYNTEKENLESQKIQIDFPEIGVEGAPWYEAVSFHTGSEETWEPLKWELEELHHSPLEDSVVLVSEQLAYLEYALSPDKAESMPEGPFEVKAVLGDVESNSVLIGFSREEDPEPTDDKNIMIARYLMTTGALVAAESLIGKMTEGAPDSTQSHIMMGEYYEAAGDYEKALESFKLALEAFERENPDEYEPPIYIEAMIAELTLLTGAAVEETTDEDDSLE